MPVPVMLHDEVVWTEPSWATSLKGAEVIYIYLKGHGWVPETPLSEKLAQAEARQAAKASNFGRPAYAWNPGYDMDYSQLEARIAERMRDYLSDVSPVTQPARAARTSYSGVYSDPPRQILRSTQPAYRSASNTWQTDLCRSWYSVRSDYNRQVRAPQQDVTYVPLTGNHDESFEALNYAYNNAPRRGETRPRSERELAANSAPPRYFPGSNVTPEQRTEQRQETVHERRAREYRETMERYRRGR